MFLELTTRDWSLSEATSPLRPIIVSLTHVRTILTKSYPFGPFEPTASATILPKTFIELVDGGALYVVESYDAIKKKLGKYGAVQSVIEEQK
jgi:hypothetical protein